MNGAKVGQQNPWIVPMLVGMLCTKLGMVGGEVLADYVSSNEVKRQSFVDSKPVVESEPSTEKSKASAECYTPFCRHDDKNFDRILHLKQRVVDLELSGKVENSRLAKELSLQGKELRAQMKNMMDEKTKSLETNFGKRIDELRAEMRNTMEEKNAKLEKRFGDDIGQVHTLMGTARQENQAMEKRIGDNVREWQAQMRNKMREKNGELEKRFGEDIRELRAAWRR